MEADRKKTDSKQTRRVPSRQYKNPSPQKKDEEELVGKERNFFIFSFHHLQIEIPKLRQFLFAFARSDEKRNEWTSFASFFSFTFFPFALFNVCSLILKFTRELRWIKERFKKKKRMIKNKDTKTTQMKKEHVVS